MKKRFLFTAVFAALLLGGMGLTSCDDDDDDDTSGKPNSSVFTIENVTDSKDFVQSGTFGVQGGQNENILPGQSVIIKFNAGKGQALMFATKYAHSNDVFFAPENPGIELYASNGTPVTGDVSAKVKLWDNGTRINQKPGPAVTHPGAEQVGNVTVISGTDAQGNQYLDPSQLMKLELAYDANSSQFTLTLTNISGGTINETPFSPGVWAISNVLNGKLMDAQPFFAANQKSDSELTALAEDGNQKPLADEIEDETGIITTLSPAIVVIYTGNKNPIYEVNTKDAGLGLKTLAQTGNASQLQASLSQMSNVKKVYIVGNKALAPGEKAEIQFTATQTDQIAYATMFGYSNDWFYANNTVIQALSTGDITDKTILLDDGTAVSQYPGAGNAQAIFGGTPIAESKVITPVLNTVFPVPAVGDIIKVTLK